MLLRRIFLLLIAAVVVGFLIFGFKKLFEYLFRKDRPPRKKTVPLDDEDARIRNRLDNLARKKAKKEERAQKKSRPALIPIKQLLEWSDLNYPILHTALGVFVIGLLLVLFSSGLQFWLWVPGALLMCLAVLMLSDYRIVRGDPPQRGVRKNWETFVGKALRPSVYFVWRWWPFFYDIKVIDVTPIRNPDNPKENPEYEFPNVMCNRKGLTDSVIRVNGSIDPSVLIEKVKKVTFEEGKDEGGFGDFNVDITMTADAETWEKVPDQTKIPPESKVDETRLIAYIKFGLADRVLDSVEDLVREAVKSIARYCTWQLLETSPEVSFLMLTWILTGEQPRRDPANGFIESTSQFKARMAREGFPDNDGFGIRFRQLNVTFTPDQKLIEATQRIAFEDVQRREEITNAETVALLVDEYKKAYTRLSDEEIKDAIEVERGKANRTIHTFRGTFPGNVLYNLNQGRGGQGGQRNQGGKRRRGKQRH